MTIDELRLSVEKLFSIEMDAIDKVSAGAAHNNSARTILFQHSDSIVKVGQLLLDIIREGNSNGRK